MKIFYQIFCMLFLFSFINSSIVLKEKEKHIVPESNKLQIQFSRTGEPMKISTNNQIDNIKSHNINNIHIDAPNVPDEHLKQHHTNTYDNHNMDNHINVHDIEPEHEKHNIENEFYEDYDFDNNSEMENIFGIFHDLTENLETGHLAEYGEKDKKDIVAYNQLEELEDELNNVLNEKDGHGVKVDPKVLKTMISYLEHLDYIHQNEVTGGDLTNPPKLPDHFRAKPRPITINDTNIDDIPELNGLPEDVGDDKVDDLEKNIDELEKQLENIKKNKEGEENENEEESEEIADLKEEKENLEDEQNTEETIKNHDESEEENNKEIEELTNTQNIMDEESEEDIDLLVKIENQIKKLEDKNLELDSKKLYLKIIERIEKSIKEIFRVLKRIEAKDPESNYIVDLETMKQKLRIKKKFYENKVLEKEEKELAIETALKFESISPEQEKPYIIVQLGKAYSSGRNDLNMSYRTTPKMSLVTQLLKRTMNHYFDDLPDSKVNVPQDTVYHLQSGLLLYEKTRHFIISYSLNRGNYKNDIKFIMDRLKRIVFTKDYFLDFYDVKEDYDELLTKIDENDEAYINKEEEYVKEVDIVVNKIKELSKNVNTIITLDELIYEEVAFLRGKIDDDTSLDSVKKSQATFNLLPKLLDIKAQMETVFDAIIEDCSFMFEERRKFLKLNGDLQHIIDENNKEVEEEIKKDKKSKNFVNILGFSAALIFLL